MAKEPPRQSTGFFADIEQLLRQQLSANPAQPDLRLKLMDVYYETGRAADFQREVETLGAALDSSTLVAERARVANMGRELGLSGPLFEQEAARPSAALPPVGASRVRTMLQRRIGDDGRYREPFATLAADYTRTHTDSQFLARLDSELQRIAQRPSPLHDAERLSHAAGGARILLKREHLSLASSRLLIAVAGQALLARKLGKTTLVTSTTSGARGVITASVAAQLGLQAVIFMDRDDLDRQKQAAFRMKLLGAELKAVTRRDLPERDVRHSALNFWAQQTRDRFPVMGLDAAPPPYGLLTREIPSVIGRETRLQVQELTGRAPDLLVARGGESPDAIGFFEPFLTERTRMACVVPSRDLGVKRKDELFGAAPGPSADTLRNIAQAELAAQEHAPVVREHSFLRASGRVEYVSAAPETARKALRDLAAREGMVPSIETAHAIAWACTEAAKMTSGQSVVVMLADTGDADLSELSRLLEGHL
jgi:tryptophan synthase beta chain